MKFKGKIAIWYWLILIAGNVLILYDIFFSNDNIWVLLIVLLFFNIIFWPIVFRNYVEINNNILNVFFGFNKYSINIDEIIEIYSTHNPISASAASLDRIVIKGKRQEIICSVCDKNTMFRELIKKNPLIKVH